LSEFRKFAKKKSGIENLQSRARFTQYGVAGELHLAGVSTLSFVPAMQLHRGYCVLQTTALCTGAEGEVKVS